MNFSGIGMDEIGMNDTGNGDTRKRGGGKKGRSGPREGQRNALRHGLKAGALPPDAKYIQHRINGLRRQLEDEVVKLKSEVSIQDAACIQTCIRWERHAELAHRWLTKQYDELTPDQRLHFSREVARASAERDKALERLKLDDKADSIFDALYGSKPKLLPSDTNGHADGAGGAEDK